MLGAELQCDNHQIMELVHKAGILGKGTALASLDEKEVAQLREYIRVNPPSVVAPEPPPEMEKRGPMPAAGPSANSRGPLSGGFGAAASREMPRAVTPARHQPSRSSSQSPALIAKPIFSEDPFLVTLLQDLEVALSNLERNSDEHSVQFYRRSYVRTFFSTAEAILATIADWLADNVKEIAMPNREKMFISSSLRATLDNVTRFSSVQYILATYGYFRGRGEDFFSDGGWKSYKKSRTIRNAMTHPSRERGVEVSDEDLKTVRDAQSWLVGVVEIIES